MPVLVLVLLTAAGEAASVKIVNLVEMTSRADRVFHGQCLKRVPQGEAAGIPIIEYTFQVRKAVKGVNEGETVVFRQLDGSVSGRSAFSGIPQYRVGQEVILFLKKESRRGLTSPVGLGQGAFAIRKSPKGEKEVVNELRNRNLFVGLSSADQAAILGGEPEDARPGEPISLARFSSLVSRVAHELQLRDNRNR